VGGRVRGRRHPERGRCHRQPGGPARQEQVEREFREAGPIEYAAGYGEGELHWLEFSKFGGRRWFEKVLRRLDTLGYTSEVTKTDSS